MSLVSCQLGLKSRFCFEDFKMILLLQDFANLKISLVVWIEYVKFQNFGVLHDNFGHLRHFSQLAFWRSFIIAGLHITILRVLDTLFIDLEYYQKIIALDRVFNKNPLSLSLNWIERSQAAISLKSKLKNHLQSYSC